MSYLNRNAACCSNTDTRLPVTSEAIMRLNSSRYQKSLGLVTRIIAADDSKLAIRKILDKFQPDLVHAHNTFIMISPSIYEACGEAGVPVLQTLQNYRLLCPAALHFRNGHVLAKSVLNTDCCAAFYTDAIEIPDWKRLQWLSCSKYTANVERGPML